MSLTKQFAIVIGSGLALILLILLSFDAYEFERTGKCRDCVILKTYFENRTDS